MSANLRDWYLDTLGVVQYRPRQEGAVDIPFHMDIEPQLESRTQLGSKPQAKTVDAEDIPPIWDASPETSPDKVVSKESPQKGEASPIQSDSALPVDPFRIACWQQGDDLLVIHGLPPGHVPVPEERELLFNLLRAIDRLVTEMPAADYIDWPLTPGEPSDLQGAKSMLSVFLDTRIRKCGVLRVLLMGELPARLLLPSQAVGTQVDFEAVLGEIEDLPGGARAIVIPSLQDMLTTVSSKQVAWRALQKLLVPRD